MDHEVLKACGVILLLAAWVGGLSYAVVQKINSLIGVTAAVFISPLARTTSPSATLVQGLKQPVDLLLGVVVQQADAHHPFRFEP